MKVDTLSPQVGGGPTLSPKLGGAPLYPQTWGGAPLYPQVFGGGPHSIPPGGGGAPLYPHRWGGGPTLSPLYLSLYFTNVTINQTMFQGEFTTVCCFSQGVAPQCLVFFIILGGPPPPGKSSSRVIWRFFSKFARSWETSPLLIGFFN